MDSEGGEAEGYKEKPQGGRGRAPPVLDFVYLEQEPEPGAGIKCLGFRRSASMEREGERFRV